ncbi:MAG: serine/threonine-protein kinase [Rhodothermales bacterium]|nr:serine/threonine-protein kinase [Rhodothermales bacterium]
MINSTLSHYKITAELGRGGMGIVYRATDTKLNRDVALKVLPAAALSSADDRARFFREAQAAAQLAHAHIATVYEIDEAILVDESGKEIEGSDGPRPFIAMEFIDGETLEERIKGGPIKLDVAVRLAIEVADALKAAHEKNIVHRDIKSANVMMSSDGKAKVLDFGLAQTTHSTMLTRMGSTLGTVAFMSPEQARGEEVDGRSDLYSLGTMLYEMVAGRLPFAGQYEQAVVYGILNEIPEPLTAIRTGVPMALEWIVNKLLAKSADDRYQTAAGLIVDLRNLDLKSSGVSSNSISSMASMSSVSQQTIAASPPSRPVKSSLIPIVAASVATLLLGLLFGFLFFRNAPESRPLQRVTIELPGVKNVTFPVLSPTNEYLAFCASDQNGNRGIFLRDMSTGDIRYVEGTERAGLVELRFSPDGDRLAYTRGSNGGVSTIVIPAGLPEQQTATGRFSYWEDSDNFVFVDDVVGGDTFRKTLGSREPELVTLNHGDIPEGYANVWKTHIPGSNISFGHQISRGGNVQTAISSLIRAKMADGTKVEVVESPIMNPEYVHGGFLAYQQRNDAGTLVVRPVDTKTGDFLGPPVEAMVDEATTWSAFSVTPAGDLMYLSGISSNSTTDEKLTFIDLENRVSAAADIIVPTGSQLDIVRYSPDGLRLAFSVDVGPESYIVVYDQMDTSLTQLTFGTIASDPFWAPDGRTLYFTTFDPVTDAFSLNKKEAIASASSEVVLSNAIGWDISSDGTLVAYTETNASDTPDRLMLLNLAKGGESVQLAETTGRIDNARFSPDGAYLAYRFRDDTVNEIRVTSTVGGRTTNLPDIQGVFPAWASNGRTLFVSGLQTYLLPVRTSPSFNIFGEPESLFSSFLTTGFDISPDGQTAVVVGLDPTLDSAVLAETEIVWLQNWSGHLQREFSR